LFSPRRARVAQFRAGSAHIPPGRVRAVLPRRRVAPVAQFGIGSAQVRRPEPAQKVAAVAAAMMRPPNGPPYRLPESHRY